MKRRTALKNIAITVGGILFLPACDTGLNSASTVEAYLSPSQEKLLTGIVDTLIPATDTPGAVALDVPTFVKRAIIHCYEKEVQDQVLSWLDAMDAMAKESFGKSFLKTSTDERISILQKIEQLEEEKEEQSEPDSLSLSYALIKELTILGYTTSEYVLTNLTDYEMMPGHYTGCVNVGTKQPV